MNRITKFGLWGAVGFGIGGIIAVTVIYVITILFDISLPGQPLLYPGAIIGCIGGASLGTLFKGWRSTTVLALAGAIGFEVGFVSGGFVGLITSFSQMPMFLTGLAYGGITGAVGGASLGLAFKDLRRTALLTLAGTIGFGVPAITSPMIWLKGLYPGIVAPPSLVDSVLLIVMLTIGGTCLGATLGFLERRKANGGSKSREN